MIDTFKIVFFFIGLFRLGLCDSVNIDLLMPNVSPKHKDSYICTSKEITDEEPVYITKFVPHSTKEIAHHILVYSCELPGRREKIWTCGEMNLPGNERQYTTGPVCKGPQNIIYAWAMDAPELSLPKDVAFKLGAGTGKRYLVMQVHYAKVDKFLDGSTDDSGIILKGQKEPVKHLAGVYFLVTGGYVNANSKQNFESACEMTEDVDFVPFAYRTHTHKLGKVNSGYLVRNDPIVGDQEQTWTEIGRRSPQLPQMFYPVNNKMTIGKGDILAARCTIENTRNHRVHIGATGDDEMCNFYIMYYTKGDLLENNVCFTNGPPNWFFEDFRGYDGNTLKLSKIPSDISEVPEDQVELLKKEGAMNHINMNMNDKEQDDIGSMDFIQEPSNAESEDDRILYMYIKKLLASRYEQ